MRQSTTALALALLWAPATNHAFPLQQPLSSSVQGGGGMMMTTPLPTTIMAAVTSDDEDSSSSFQDWEALDRKNMSRQKFGLEPMTVSEFIAHEAAVQQMTFEQQQRQEHLASAQQQQQRSQSQSSSSSSQNTFVPSFIEKMMDQVLPDQCESNWDCEQPKICCDFGAAKVCCAGGSKQQRRMGGGVQGQLELIPVPLGKPQGPVEY